MFLLIRIKITEQLDFTSCVYVSEIELEKSNIVLNSNNDEGRMCCNCPYRHHFSWGSLQRKKQLIVPLVMTIFFFLSN